VPGVLARCDGIEAEIGTKGVVGTGHVVMDIPLEVQGEVHDVSLVQW
jgi:hypothetical protein